MNNNRRPISIPQALNRASALCSRSEQAPSAIREKLLKWGLTPNEASQVLQRLLEEDFLNEERFSRAFVNDRFEFNGWGRIKIAHQLRVKGIDSDVINRALTVIDEARYRERLIELLQAKWQTVKHRELRAAWAAMMRFASSRGFEASLSSECVKQVSRIDAEDD